MIEFTIPGQPIPKGRPRFGRNGSVYTPKTTIAFEKKVKLSALAAGVKQLSGPIQISTEFYMKDLRRVDADNILKAVMDALNGVAYKDDSQVMTGRWSKHLDKANPRTVVTVEPLPGESKGLLGGVEILMQLESQRKPKKTKTQQWAALGLSVFGDKPKKKASK